MRPNLQTLLVITAVIIVFKWLLMPLYSWQSEQASRLQQQSKLIDKSEFIIEQQPLMIKQAQAINESLNDNNSVFFLFEQNAKLSIQRELEQIFTEHDISIRGFDWISDIPSSNDVDTIFCKINIKGQLHQLIQLHAVISDINFMPRFYFKEIDLKSNRGNGSIQSFDGYVIVSVLTKPMDSPEMDNSNG